MAELTSSTMTMIIFEYLFSNRVLIHSLLHIILFSTIIFMCDIFEANISHRMCSCRWRKIILGSENVGANVDTRGAHEYVNCTNLFIVSLQ